METIFMNKENSKTNGPHKLLTFHKYQTQGNSDKHVALQNLSLYYTWKNIGKQYEDNKLQIIAPPWDDEFELKHGSYSVSDIQDYFEYIIKNMKH